MEKFICSRKWVEVEEIYNFGDILPCTLYKDKSGNYYTKEPDGTNEIQKLQGVANDNEAIEAFKNYVKEIEKECLED